MPLPEELLRNAASRLSNFSQQCRVGLAELVDESAAT
jgi:hypothetical protein